MVVVKQISKHALTTTTIHFEITRKKRPQNYQNLSGPLKMLEKLPE